MTSFRNPELIRLLFRGYSVRVAHYFIFLHPGIFCLLYVVSEPVQIVPWFFAMPNRTDRTAADA